MNALINRLISEAAAPIEKAGARVFKKAMLFLVAMSCLFAGSIFLTIALFFFVQSLAGTAIAALCAGVLYLGVALIWVMVAARERSRHGAPAAADSGRATESREAPPWPNLEFARNIDEAVAPVLDILHDAGYERERLALAAGTEIAKQLHPFSLAALAIVAGYILGRILKQTNVPPE